MEATERVKEFLQERNPQLEVVELPEDTSTVPLAAQALGTEEGQIAKSILFKSKDDAYLMVVAAGDVRLDSKAIKKQTGKKVRMANAEEVREVTGFNIGGVCPFGMLTAVPVFLDESLRRYDLVYAAAGTPHAILPITYEQLQQVTGGQPCQFSL